MREDCKWPIRHLKAAVSASLLLAALGLWIGTVEADSASPPGHREVLVEALDRTGEVITGRVAEDLVVFEDGEEASVIVLGEVGNRWRIVLYFDQLLASPTDFHNATIQLGERARDLTRLGSVELLVASQDVSVALPASREPDAISQALGWLRLRDTAEHLQVKLRRDFLERLAGESSAAPPAEATAIAELARMHLTDESELLRRFREQLLLWAADHAAPGPNVLLLIGSGYDDDPAAFYRRTLIEAGWPRIAESLKPAEPGLTSEELAQALAVYGWTLLPYTSGQRGDALLEETEEELAARKEEEMTDVVFQDGQIVDKTTIGFNPEEILERRRRRQQESAEVEVLGNPEGPYRLLADSTGGEMLRGKFQLSDVLNRLSRRFQLRIEPRPEETGPDPRELVTQVRLRPDGTTPAPALLRARRWLAAGTPQSVSAVRARHILEEELDQGELTLSAALQPTGLDDEARLIVKRDTYTDPEDLAGPVRVTVAVGHADGGVEVSHRQEPGWQVLPKGDPEAEPMLELPLAAEPDGVVVILVEELATGLWGGTFASYVEPSDLPFDRARGLESLILPAPQVVHLLAPAQGFAMGPTRFETVISDSGVIQVDFYLDGEREAVSRSAPFTATLDLGSLPQPRRVEAVALDEDGQELGRDYLVVNEGSGVFGVRIVEPETHSADGKPRRLVGPVDVEAEVEPRRGEGIDRVEFFWNDTLVATRYARPFRQRVVVPEDDPTGFIRVVAYLDDGNSSEDLILVNSTGPSERLQVNLMELYVVVTDRHGRPVKGLDRSAFRIEEEGVAQDIATFSDAGELPLTVGMVIDSSASMFVKLPDVRFAASEFLRGLATRRDRAFVVGFGDEPRLTRATTSDLPDIIQSLDRLRPDGQTAIWKAIVYSLVQLQGVPGKKALIVYTDGADEDPDFSFRTALKFARKVGVPIYIILSNNEIRRTEGKGLQVKDFLGRLEELTDSVGGKIYMARVGEDLQAVYQEIDEELRSQYVLGYYSEGRGGREWRQVKVDLDMAGHKARTIAGFFR